MSPVLEVQRRRLSHASDHFKGQPYQIEYLYSLLVLIDLLITSICLDMILAS